jgi:hypothetical protein
MTYRRVAALGVLALAVAAICVARSVEFIGGQGAESPDGKWRADVAGPIDQPVLTSIEVSSTQSPHLSKSIRFNAGLPLKQPVRGGKRLIQWSADSKQCSIGSDGDPVVFTIDVAAFVGVEAP